MPMSKTRELFGTFFKIGAFTLSLIHISLCTYATAQTTDADLAACGFDAPVFLSLIHIYNHLCI